MAQRRRHASWLERVPLRGAYPLIGVLLAIGAPLGLLLVRALQRREAPSLDWAAAEVGSDVAGYGYSAISTTLVFAALGFVLGTKEDRMRSLMMTDALTGLFNRRYLSLRLADELARAARYGGELSLLAIDVDRLKAINDCLGHEGGDRSLVNVATAIRTSLRATDIAARYGGDEFVVLCPMTSAVESNALTQRIRARLEDLVTETHVTVSIGVADLRSSQASTASDLFSAADRALYEAKAAGGNRANVAIRHDAHRDRFNPHSHVRAVGS